MPLEAKSRARETVTALRAALEALCRLCKKKKKKKRKKV
jgi:hypothetical protein